MKFIVVEADVPDVKLSRGTEVYADPTLALKGLSNPKTNLPDRFLTEWAMFNTTAMLTNLGKENIYFCEDSSAFEKAGKFFLKEVTVLKSVVLYYNELRTRIVDTPNEKGAFHSKPEVVNPAASSKREERIHYIMYSVINGAIDINTPGIEGYLKGKDDLINHLRQMDNDSLNQVYHNAHSGFRKLPVDIHGVVKMFSPLLKVVWVEMGINERPLSITSKLVEYLECCFDDTRIHPISSLEKLVKSTYGTCMPRSSVVTAFVRKTTSKYVFSIIIKADPTDSIWW